LWQLVLTQGVLVGVGGCLVYYPITTMAAEYFEGKRATAIGVWSMGKQHAPSPFSRQTPTTHPGSGLGGLFFSPVLNSLIAAAGILKTYYVLAAVNLAVGLLVALVCPPPRALARPRQRVLSRALWRSPVLHLLAGAGFLNALVAGLPTNFGPDFGRALGFGLTGCAWHLALVNGCGAAARLALGCLGDRWGSRGMQPLASGGAAVAVVALWLPSAWRASGAAWVAFLVAYGGLIAAWGQYQSPVLLEVFGSDVYFAANAVVSFCRGVGTIIGSPVGGAILGNSSRVESARQYTRLAVFTAVILTLNAAFTGVAWYLSRKGRKEEKQEEKCKKTEC
jgi:MFS family permease